MRKQEAQALSAILDESLRNLQIDGKIHESRVTAAWAEVVGPVIAAHTIDRYIAKQILFVKLDTPILRSELQMMRLSLIEKLNKAAGAETIRDIVFR